MVTEGIQEEMVKTEIRYQLNTENYFLLKNKSYKTKKMDAHGLLR